MTQANLSADDIALTAERLIRTLPLHLQRTGWQSQEPSGGASGMGKTPPCKGSDCDMPPCKGTMNCIKTIIGHDPEILIVVVAALLVALAIGVGIGYFIALQQGQSTQR